MTKEQLTASLAGFACAFEEFDEPFQALALTTHGREVWGSLQASSKASGRSAITSEMSAMVDQRFADPQAAWHRSMGLSMAALQGGGVDAETAVAALGLRLSAGGVTGTWSCRARGPAALQFDQFYLPAASGVEVDSRSGQCSIRLSDGADREVAVLTFFHDETGWQLGTGSAEIQRQPSVSLGGQRIGLYLEKPSWAEAAPGGALPRQDVDVEAFKAAMGRGYLLLEQHAPAYARWVSRVLRGIAPLAADSGLMKSSSDRLWPGVIAMSGNACAAGIAEMLVHECAHQHYHQAGYLGSVDDGSDTTLHYSPVKRTGRPLSRILLAFHAFANVSLMNEELIAGGAGDARFCEQNRRSLPPQLERMAGVLESSGALTEVGRGLFRPLATRWRRREAA